MTVFLQKNATIEQAVEAKQQGYVVLADWAGRRVTINAFAQNEQTKEWSACWSHADYPNARWDTVTEDDRFIIRDKFASHR